MATSLVGQVIRDPLRTYRLPDVNGRTQARIYNKSDKPACLQLISRDMSLAVVSAAAPESTQEKSDQSSRRASP
jgi:hypothetical protein